MPIIPGISWYNTISVGPIQPYKFVITRIYKLLLEQGETVVSCKPVMYEGYHVAGMYDVVITNFNDPNPGRCSDGTIANKILRLIPTKTKDWNDWQ